MKTYSHILFDNDGVLVDTEKLYYESTKSAFFKQTDIQIDWELFEQYFLFDNKGSKGLLTHFNITTVHYEDLVSLRDAEYADALNGTIPVIDGVLPTLEKLKPMVKMAIVTSCKRAHFEVMHRSTGILEYMYFIIANEDVNFTKPHPEPYLIGAQQFDIEPDQILVVEDSVRGLASATAAGLDCAVIPQYSNTPDIFQGATYILNHITDICSLINS